MTTICLYLSAHTPLQFNTFSFFDVGQSKPLVDENLTLSKLHDLVDSSLLPGCQKIMDLAEAYNGKFRVALSLSGNLLELIRQHRPDMLMLLQKLSKTNSVEFLCQPYYHSLSIHLNEEHFKYQVQLHRNKVQELFGFEPSVLANTELNYHKKLPVLAEELGLKGILSQSIMSDGRSATIFQPLDASEITCLAHSKNVVDHFDCDTLHQLPVNWTRQLSCQGDLINVFSDFDALKSDGQVNFCKCLFNSITEILANDEIDFGTPSDIIQQYRSGDFDLSDHKVSTHDSRKHSGMQFSSRIQKDALSKLCQLENRVMQAGDAQLLDTWSQLQDTRHFTCMSGPQSDSDSNPSGDLSYKAYISFMNIIADLETRLNYVIEMNKLKVEQDREYLKSA